MTTVTNLLAQPVTRIRKPRTPEHSAAIATAKQLRIKQNLELYGTRTAPTTLAKFRKTLEDTAATREAKATVRRNNSMAKDYVFVLQFWIITLLRAETNFEVFDELVVGQPQLEVRWDHHHNNILFSLSTLEDIRSQYGTLAEGIFRKLFVCVQPGGFSRETRTGYKSVWMINKQALDIWLITTTGRNGGQKTTVSAIMKALNKIEPLRRAATDYTEVTNEFGLLELQGQNKKILTPAQRQAALATRLEKQTAVDQKNQKTMSAWSKKAVA